jgi:hypothetical protein
VRLVIRRLALPALIAVLAACQRDADAPPPPPAPTSPSSPTRGEPPDAGLTQEDRLRRGRELARAEDWEAAVAELETAFAANPSDGAVVTELGWALFRTGRLERAHAVMQPFVMSAAPGVQRAAALYNLGRVAEVRGEREVAATYYQSSLADREHQAVRRRLAAVAPATTFGDEFRPRSTAGPFADLAAYCAPDGPASGACQAVPSDDIGGATRLNAPTPPWLDARVLVVGWKCRLALRTARGWFVADLEMDCVSSHVAHINELAARDLLSSARGPEIELRATTHTFSNPSGWGPDDGARDQCAGYAVVCGLGSSGVPACTPAVETGWAQTDCVPEPPRGGWEGGRSVAVRGGALVVRNLPGDHSKQGAGTYPLLFP